VLIVGQGMACTGQKEIVLWTFADPTCQSETQATQQAQATATATARPTPTATPSNEESHTIRVYKGLKSTSPSEFTNFANPDPAKGEPGGYSAYEVLLAPYKFQLPFLVTYKGEKGPAKRGTVVGVELKSGKTHFNAGVAVYTPQLENPTIGKGHWSIFVIDRAISAEELKKLKDAMSDYAKDYFGKLK
jgi:hypothetical protein